MKGRLVHIPSTEELSRLYYELAKRGAPAVGEQKAWPYEKEAFDTQEKLLTLAAEMSRYDARLLGVLVQWTTERWQCFNPLALRIEMKKMRYPQTLCVVLDFALETKQAREFEFFCRYVREGWEKVMPQERFFVDTFKPGSRTAQAAVGRNLRAYERWGFVGTERPVVDVATKQTVGRYGPVARQWILRRLVERYGSFTLSDYLEALDESVSRQQALSDLKKYQGLRLRGHGRGARWTFRPKPHP